MRFFRRRRSTTTPPDSVIRLPDSIVQLPRPKPEIVLPSDRNLFHPAINGQNQWNCAQVYDFQRKLGEGTFGSVYKARHKFLSSYDEHDDEPDWKYVAIKKTKPNVLDYREARRGLCSYDDLKQNCQELKALLHLQDGRAAPNNGTAFPVAQLYEFFWTGRDLYMVTELLGQELGDWRNTECESFSEKDAIAICQSVLGAIEYIHSKRVIHRDIKMQNILFRENGNFKSLKIVDFGLSRVLDAGESVNHFCGSPGYIAPEMYVGEHYRFEVDMFAFGVVLFRLLSGERPFSSNNDQALKRSTIQLRYNVQGSSWEGISDSAKDLVRKLLINREERLTAEQALDHVWFLEEGRSTTSRTDLTQLDQDSHSRFNGFAFSHAPTASTSAGAKNRFWIDSSAEMALATVISHGIYFGHQVDATSNDGSGMIYIEEDVIAGRMPVPEYISQSKVYTEKDCRFLCRQLANAIKCFHDAGLAHRNLHLKNILVDSWGQLSLKGLHHAQPLSENKPLTGHFGNKYSWYAFKAPEIDIEFAHDKSVDLWSLGVTIYMLLTGFPPFHAEGEKLIEAKHTGRFNFDITPVSAPAQRLVRGLIEVLPEKRYSLEQVLNHPWMVAADDYLEAFPLELAVEELERFK